jgi:hypothetical protein
VHRLHRAIFAPSHNSNIEGQILSLNYQYQIHISRSCAKSKLIKNLNLVRKDGTKTEEEEKIHATLPTGF